MVKIDFTKVQKWFAATEDSIKHSLNFKEIKKVLLTAAASGVTVYGLIEVLAKDLPNIVTDPTYLSLVQRIVAELMAQHWIPMTVFIIMLLGETYRRYHQGEDLKAPKPGPEPKPEGESEVKPEEKPQ